MEKSLKGVGRVKNNTVAKLAARVMPQSDCTSVGLLLCLFFLCLPLSLFLFLPPPPPTSPSVLIVLTGIGVLHTMPEAAGDRALQYYCQEKQRLAQTAQNENTLLSSYLSCKHNLPFSFHCFMNLLFQFYQGAHSEEVGKHGEAIAWYQFSLQKLHAIGRVPKSLGEAARDAVKNFNSHVQDKLQTVKRQNDQVYHDSIPDVELLEPTQGIKFKLVL